MSIIRHLRTKKRRRAGVRFELPSHRSITLDGRLDTTEVASLYLLVRGQVSGGTSCDYTAKAEHVSAIAERQRCARVLLHEKDRDTGVSQLSNNLEDRCDYEWRKSQRWLIE